MKRQIFDGLFGLCLIGSFLLCVTHSFQPNVVVSSAPQWCALAAAFVFGLVSTYFENES
ncbi:hypothetical protein LMG22037_05939 [Paraburkholderia phenoliruptrix]|uniref:Uncharacterized protein n=1 Tax=Paraburkholderia phenoliruptrix TaxID=252970 RepID=A0A6J5CH76_9BURK|nr:hypothetical protein LMG22037_05939 [Paraburkholderia phenoliruptrix]